ncbi:MAG: hypothetical protein V4590_01385 [Bacteroidota bacterium]
MKNWIFLLLLALFTFSVSGTVANTPVNQTKHTATYSAKLTKSERNILVARVYEIRDMNLSSLNNEEKVRLSNELKDIKAKLAEPGFTGLYISSGVIIIILIVLLLLAID